MSLNLILSIITFLLSLLTFILWLLVYLHDRGNWK